MDTTQPGSARALSPVVGVVLMVAITVLLVATAGTFFLGFGNAMGQPGAPTLAFDHQYEAGSSDALHVDVTGGETVDRERVRVVVRGANCGGAVDPNRRYTPRSLGATTTKLMAGTTLDVAEWPLCWKRGKPPGWTAGQLDLSAAEVTVVWIDAGGDRSHTYYEWTGPDA